MLVEELTWYKDLARSSWRPFCKSCMGRWHVYCKAGEQLHRYNWT